MKRALLVGADDARGLVAAARSLGRAGWYVGVASPTPRSPAAVSRHVSSWHRLSSSSVAGIAGSVSVAVADGGYDVVVPGGDAELFALSERREDIGCAVPYGSRESVRCVLDKLAMTEEARRRGVPVPETAAATDRAILDARGTVVLKSASHVDVRTETLVSADPTALRLGAREMRAAGARPLIQDHLVGPLMALSVVIGQGGDVLAAVQQRAGALWPPAAGVSARAHTVAVDQPLLERVAAFLAGIGWRGLAELQFIETDDGPRLIDVNGRCYGSLALAAAAGVELVEVWASSALGEERVSPPARVGARFQWLYGDLRHAWSEGRAPVGPLLRAARSAHPVWDRQDLRPARTYARFLARSVLSGVRR